MRSKDRARRSVSIARELLQLLLGGPEALLFRFDLLAFQAVF